jgi:hypothetical protein
MFLIAENYSLRKIIQVFVLVFISILTFNKSYAQIPKVLAFGNFTYAVPTNTEFKNISNYGTGYEIGAGFGFGKTMFIASLGQMIYNIPNNGLLLPLGATGQPDKFKVTPIKVGFRRYLLFGLFLNGNIGMAIQKYDKYTATGNSFLYELGAGCKLSIFEFGAAYTGYQMAGTEAPNANSLLLKAGIAIKL